MDTKEEHSTYKGATIYRSTAIGDQAQMEANDKAFKELAQEASRLLETKVKRERIERQERILGKLKLLKQDMQDISLDLLISSTEKQLGELKNKQD